MSEASYQRKLIKEYEAEGWYVIRLITTNKSGIPDLLCLKDNNKPLFIEVKATKGKPSKLQEFRIKELKSNGFDALIMFEPN